MTDLADRYAGARRGRLVVVVAATVVAVAFLGWLAWSTWSYSTPEIRSELVSYEVTGEHEAVALVDVHMRDGSIVGTCTLQAFATDHSVVGERVFEVPGPDEGPDEGTVDGDGGTMTITVRTERRATSVELVGCTAPGQSRPR
jgi:hypothetical protein